MITEVLQEEKEKVSELLVDVSNTVDKLQFLSISDYQVSKEFKDRWELKLKKFFSDIDNYQKNEFPLVVLGRWNSGKSTLINAILGKEVLPSANKEMTSILTKIYYGKDRDVILKFNGEKDQNIQIEEIEDYINFRGKKYTEKLKQINIKSDNPFLKSGLCILDTPGLSSINDLNNHITFEVIPRANSLILTFSGLDVGGNDNLNLIEQVFRLNYNNLYNVVFVITKSDLLSEKEYTEAEESLRELITIAQKNTGVKANFVQICRISPYMELKYQQYLAHDISERQLLNDSKLNLANIDRIQKIHNMSNFDEFYKILNESILSSENKKNITSNLFIRIQSVLAELLDDYNNTYSYLAKSNSSSLEDISVTLQHKVDIVTKIRDEGKIEIENFNNQIEGLKRFKDYNVEQANKIINDIYVELCDYIDATPYQLIAKDKFAALNQEVDLVSKKLLSEWMKEIKKEFDDKLNDTIMKIAEIIEKNSREINEAFVPKSQEETNLEIYKIRITGNAIVTNFMISIASSASVGAGLFAIGNGILPGIGGIVGSIMGGLIGFLVSLPASDRKKEILKEKLYKYLFDYSYKYKDILDELHLQYKNTGKLLERYLNATLKQAIQERVTIIKNYNETKKRYEEIEGKMKVDIKSIKELMPEISLTFSKYFTVPMVNPKLDGRTSISCQQ